MQISLLLIPLLSASSFALPNAQLQQRSDDPPWIGYYHRTDENCKSDKHPKYNLTTPQTLEPFTRPMKSNVGVHFGTGDAHTNTINAYLDRKGKKIAHTFVYAHDVFQCFNDQNDAVWAEEWKSAESMG